MSDGNLSPACAGPPKGLVTLSLCLGLLVARTQKTLMTPPPCFSITKDCSQLVLVLVRMAATETSRRPCPCSAYRSSARSRIVPWQPKHTWRNKGAWRSNAAKERGAIPCNATRDCATLPCGITRDCATLPCCITMDCAPVPRASCHQKQPIFVTGHRLYQADFCLAVLTAPCQNSRSVVGTHHPPSLRTCAHYIAPHVPTENGMPLTASHTWLSGVLAPHAALTVPHTRCRKGRPVVGSELHARIFIPAVCRAWREIHV